MSSPPPDQSHPRAACRICGVEMATRDYPGGDLMVYLPRHPRGAEVACPGSGDSFGPDQVVPGPPENPLTDQEGPTSP